MDVQSNMGAIPYRVKIRANAFLEGVDQLYEAVHSLDPVLADKWYAEITGATLGLVIDLRGVSDTPS